MLRRAAGHSACKRLLGQPVAPRSAGSTRAISVLLAKQPQQQHAVIRASLRRLQHQQPGHSAWLREITGSTSRVAVLGAPRAASRSISAAAAGRAAELKARNRKVAIYMASVVTAVLGVSYAAVPLYKVFCQVTGFGGTTQVADADKALKMSPVEGGRVIRVTFDGGTADTMPWKFRPTQSDVKVVPGETALAFFTAKNPTKKHITGVATYNVFPLKAGIYFNKIQCFCFEEQRLRSGEEIDMPVFFFLDPEMLDDPAMDSVNNVTLSYTFFQTAEEDAVLEQQEEDEDEDGRGGQIGGGRTIVAGEVEDGEGGMLAAAAAAAQS